MNLQYLYKEYKTLTDQELGQRKKIDTLCNKIREKTNEILSWPVSKICYTTHKDLIEALQHLHSSTLKKYSAQETIDCLQYILNSTQTWLYAEQNKIVKNEPYEVHESIRHIQPLSLDNLYKKQIEQKQPSKETDIIKVA